MVLGFLARLRALTLFVCLGCADRGAAYPVAPDPVPIAALPARYGTCAADPNGCNGGIELLAEKSTRTPRPEILLTGPLSAAEAVSVRRSSSLKTLSRGIGRALSAQAPAQPSAPTPEATAPPQAGKELIDLEATVVVETRDIQGSAARARALTRAVGGEIVTDTFENNAVQAGYALSLRVPSDRALFLVDSLTRLGKVRSQKVQATDMSRRITDADAVLRNLELTLARYQELTKKAENVAELTTLEGELDRVRTSIDRVKTDLAWMRDRVSRSTVYLQLALPSEERISEEAKLYPGLRMPFALTRDPAGTSSRYFGGGVSVLVTRAFNLDLDVMTDLDGSKRHGLDLVTASLGVELYSNLLGAGRRRFLNPYFGFRAGYANRFGDDAVSVGGSLGLELVRTDFAFVALDTRAHALLGTDTGTQLLFQPAAVLNVAY
jgi:hypothetical protein